MIRKTVVVIVCGVALALGVEPNYVRTTTYTRPGNGVVSTSYSDGLGRSIQRQLHISGNRAVVSGTVYDQVGREWKSPVPFVHTFGQDYEYFTDDLIQTANNYYGAYDHYEDLPMPKPNAEGYAYSEITYCDDPLGRTKVTGAPGEDFHLLSGNATRLWYFGRDDVGNLFLPSDSLVVSELDDRMAGTLSGFDPGDPNSCFYLQITRNPDKQWSQTLTDVFGNTVRTWSNAPEATAEPITAYYSYDILGNVLYEVPNDADGSEPSVPEESAYATKYTYNTLGQVIDKTTPDAGMEKHEYDEAGRLTKSWSARDLEEDTDEGQYITRSYDALGRVVLIGYETGKSFPEPLVRKMYTPDSLHYYDTYDNYGVGHVIPLLRNTRGRLVAEAHYADNEETGGECVVDVFSYDDEGRVERKYKKIPGLPLQEFRYTYSLSGQVLSRTYDNGHTVNVRSYVYDDMDNPRTILRGYPEETVKVGVHSGARLLPYDKKDGAGPWAEDWCDGVELETGGATHSFGVCGRPPAGSGWSWVLYKLPDQCRNQRLSGIGGYQDGSGSIDVHIRLSAQTEAPSESEWIDPEGHPITTPWQYIRGEPNGKGIDVALGDARWLWIGLFTANGGSTDWGVLGELRIGVTQKELVNYDYLETQQLAQTGYSGGQDDIAYNRQYRNIRGWMTENSTYPRGTQGTIFRQELHYTDGAANAYYGGNVARSRYHYSFSGTYDLSYEYDKVNRLRKTVVDIGDPRAPDNAAGYNEAFEYDNIGRFKKKVEGSSDPLSSNREYDYMANSNRLKRIENHPEKGADGTYLYDPNGNMVVDRSKSMVIEYDWRDMPVRFKFFKEMDGVAALEWDPDKSLATQVEEGGGILVSEVRMMYDASGNRVLKTALEPAGGTQ